MTPATMTPAIPCPACDATGVGESGPTPGCSCGGCTETVTCDLCDGRRAVDAGLAGRWVGERASRLASCPEDRDAWTAGMADEARRAFVAAFGESI